MNENFSDGSPSTATKSTESKAMTTYERADGEMIGDYSHVLTPEFFDEDFEGTWVIKREWREVVQEVIFLGPRHVRSCDACEGIGRLSGPWHLRCMTCKGEGIVEFIPPRPEVTS